MILLKPYKNSEKYTICKILLFGCFVNKKNLLTLHSESLVFEQPRMLNRGIAESLKRCITIHSGTLISLASPRLSSSKLDLALGSHKDSTSSVTEWGRLNDLTTKRLNKFQRKPKAESNLFELC